MWTVSHTMKAAEFDSDGKQIQHYVKCPETMFIQVICACDKPAQITLGSTTPEAYHPTKSWGGADVVAKWSGIVPAGSNIYTSVRSLLGATAKIDIMGFGINEVSSGFGSELSMFVMTPQQVKPQIKALTFTSVGAGAIAIAFTPETIYQIWDLYYLIISQNIGAVTVTVDLTDGTTIYQTHDYVFAGSGGQVVELEAHFDMLTHPFPLNRGGLYFNASATATAGGQSLIFRGDVSDRMVG